MLEGAFNVGQKACACNRVCKLFFNIGPKLVAELLFVVPYDIGFCNKNGDFKDSHKGRDPFLNIKRGRRKQIQKCHHGTVIRAA